MSPENILTLARVATVAQDKRNHQGRSPDRTKATGRNKEPFTEMGKLWVENICGGGNQEFGLGQTFEMPVRQA